MKKPYMLIILVSIITGIFIGYTMKKDYVDENSIINKDEITYKSIKRISKNIKRLSKEKGALDKELNEIKKEYLNLNQRKQIENLMKQVSYTPIKSKGIEIEIDAVNDKVGNIANLVDYNNILINLINNLKYKGAQYIYINNQRINQYTEIVLAGNHINVNSIPIAPPYEIYAIGDKLGGYEKESNYYIENLINNYPIIISISELKDISIPKLEVENKLNYIKGE
jgi:uncharacterized protein YlxW (UPF0749 family)